MNSDSKVILGMAAAALVGVGIGMLVAPCSGDETRSNLREKTNSIANRLLTALRDNGRNVSDTFSDVADNVKSTYNQAKGYVKSEANHARSKMEEVA